MVFGDVLDVDQRIGSLARASPDARSTTIRPEPNVLIMSDPAIPLSRSSPGPTSWSSPLPPSRRSLPAAPSRKSGRHRR